MWAARWYLPFVVIEDLVDVAPELENQEKSTISSLLWTRLRNLELATVLPLLGIDFWLFQELTEYSPTIALDSANVAWILPQNEGEGDADADALQIRRLIDAQVNAVLSLEARGWLPEKIGLHESPYDMAADNIISGESPEIVSNLDQLELPFKAMMILDATIRAGFPEFIQDVYL